MVCIPAMVHHIPYLHVVLCNRDKIYGAVHSKYTAEKSATYSKSATHSASQAVAKKRFSVISRNLTYNNSRSCKGLQDLK